MTDQTTALSLKTWTAAFSEWLITGSNERKPASPRTMKAYLSDLDQFSIWFQDHNGEPFRPDLMNSADLRSYASLCIDVLRMPPSTWNRRRMALSAFCAWASASFGNARINFKTIRKLKAEKQAPHWITHQERGRLVRSLEIEINAANTPVRRWRAMRDQAMIILMLYGGLRVSEISDLRLGAIQISDRKGEVTVFGKGSKYRDVPFSPAVRNAMAEWLKIRPDTGNPNDHCFLGNDHRPLTSRAVQKRVVEIGQAAKIDNLACHRLRHTFVKNILDSGYPLTVARDLAGHEDIRTTAGYATPGKEDLEEAVEAGEIGRRKG